MHKICYWDDAAQEQRERDSTPEEDAQRDADIAAATVPVVPQSVTRRQARQALLLAGLLDQVPAKLAAIPDATQRGMATIEWEDSLEFERHRPLVVSIGAALGLDSAQLDALFVTAAGL